MSVVADMRQQIPLLLQKRYDLYTGIEDVAPPRWLRWTYFIVSILFVYSYNQLLNEFLIKNNLYLLAFAGLIVH